MLIAALKLRGTLGVPKRSSESDEGAVESPLASSTNVSGWELPAWLVIAQTHPLFTQKDIEVSWVMRRPARATRSFVCVRSRAEGRGGEGRGGEGRGGRGRGGRGVGVTQVRHASDSAPDIPTTGPSLRTPGVHHGGWQRNLPLHAADLTRGLPSLQGEALPARSVREAYRDGGAASEPAPPSVPIDPCSLNPRSVRLPLARVAVNMLRTTVGHIKDILGIFGQCAAISDTPIPFPYVQMAKVFTIMFLYTLPFALVTELEGFTIIAVWILALGYFGLDAIATEMEDPVRVLDTAPPPSLA